MDPEEPRASDFVWLLAILAAGTLVSRGIAPDYWDRGRLGVPVTIAVGLALGVVTLRLAGMRWRRATAATLATVAPWSPGLAGMAWIGGLFLPVEIVASALIVRARSRRSFLLSLSIALVLRALALGAVVYGLPFVVGVGK